MSTTLSAPAAPSGTAASVPSTAVGALPGAPGVAPNSAQANPYGLGALWLQGDWVAKACLLLLTIMSVGSWVVLVTKYLELRRLHAHTAQAQGVLDHRHNFVAKVQKLDDANPLKLVAQSGADAARGHAALRGRVDYDTWIVRAIEQALGKIQTQMQDGMAMLATIGSTAPFVGLFGTVWAIYSALVKIGASGQASIDRVAGPVGEALIMTAIGLAVAVPAVFGYNWLLRKNKLAFEAMRGFGAALHTLLLSVPAESAAPAAHSATQPSAL